MVLFQPCEVVHGAVEVLGLTGMGMAYDRPAVGGEASGSAGLTSVTELAAGANEDAGQGVERVRVSRHG